MCDSLKFQPGLEVNAATIDQSKCYLAKYVEDGTWYRAAVYEVFSLSSLLPDQNQPNLRLPLLHPCTCIS